MRRVLLTMMVLATLVVVSCSKDKSFEQGSGGAPVEGDLLTKVVIQLGADSATTSFSYDASKRLVSETNQGDFSIVSGDSLQRVTRNAEGIIQKVTVYPTSLPSDMYEYTVRYDATSKRYTSKLFFDASGNVQDSIAYAYDASGKIARASYFVNFGSGFELLGKDTIIYDGSNNIIKVATYKFEDPNWVDLSELAFTYDTKVNPLKLSQEAIVLERYQFHGNNNPSKITYVDFDTPALNEEISLTYSYSATDKPATANMGMTGTSGTTLPITFRYK